MKNIKKILLILLLILPFAFTYKVSADEILNVDNIKQIQNQYNVQFRVINNHEVAAIYEDLGDTLEFEVTVKNTNSKKNVRLKNITILTDSEGVDYTANMNSDNLELKPGETRTIRVTGVLNNKAFDSEKIIKVQIRYTISDVPCPDCNKPIPVIVNPTTGDTINYSFIILAGSIIGLIILVILFIIFKKKRNKSIMILLLALSLNICLFPIYNVKADEEYILEIIIHQTIRIKKIDDRITVKEVIKPYTGEPVDGDFDNTSKTTITPIYYEDDECQNPIQGKPVDAGVYYATATSEGNNWYKPSNLQCTKVVTINKIPSSCPMIEDVEGTYNGNDYSLIIGEGIVGGELYYSLDNQTWTKSKIKVSNAGIHTVYVKVIGDKNHEDISCGEHTITINKKAITIKATDQSKVYDGTPLVADSTCEIVNNSNDFSVQCTTQGSIENVGEADKIITNVIIKDGELDVTNNYEIIPEKGKLIVTPNPISKLGGCIRPTYSSYEQNLIEGGYLVEYTDNIGKDAGDYTIIANASPNYAFEDGTTTKTISCPVLKRGLEITPVNQDIKYGEDINTGIEYVVATNLIEGHAITNIDLSKQDEQVTDNGIIKASNAIIKEGNEDKTNNYEITYNDGIVTIFYYSAFVAGNHCETTSPSVKKSYNNSLKLNTINPSIGYSAEGWYKDNVRVGSSKETITIDGNYTYVSNCIDDIPPTIKDVSIETEDSDFTITVTAQDLGSGSKKIEWFYKKCGEEIYHQLDPTNFDPTNEEIIKSNKTNSCLSYGTYYVYVKVTDDAGNVQTLAPIKFDLNNPTTDKVRVNSSNVGTTCKSLECTLNELLRYFK